MRQKIYLFIKEYLFLDFFRNYNFKEFIWLSRIYSWETYFLFNRCIYIYNYFISLYLHEIYFNLKLLIRSIYSFIINSSIYFRNESHFFFRLCFIRIPGESRAYFVPTIGKRTCSRRYANRYCPRRYVASNCLS